MGEIGIAYLFVSIAVFSVGCQESNPLEPTYPERANYTLVLQAAASRAAEDSSFIITIQADGKSLRKLPLPHHRVYWVLASPDERFVAFRAGSDHLQSLYIYDFQSGETRRILYEKNWDEYAWSPDSRRIVFENNEPSRSMLKIVDVTSGSVEPLTDMLAGQQRWPRWSPDGKAIAFTNYLTDSSGSSVPYIYVFEFDKRAFRKLFQMPYYIWWSPGARYIVVPSELYSWPDLNLVKNLALISSSITGASFPKWLPNGKQLLFPRLYPIDEGIYKLDLETWSLTKILSGPSGRLTVSKDGTLIAFMTENGFVVMKEDGSGVVKTVLPYQIHKTQFLGDIPW